MTFHGSALRFALIGVIATVVHMISGTVLIQLRVAPLVANICGFVTAFGVSFLGHHYFSFAGHANRLVETLNRFARVAVIGFGINQAVLALLLHLYPGTGKGALMISTLTAAFATFMMSHFWAFRKQPDDKKNISVGSGTCN